MQETSASQFGQRYVLQQQIGAGGMGVVYRALDRLTNEPVALKRVSSTPSVATDITSVLDVRLALAQEFQTLASIRHPHIIGVRDYGFEPDGKPYFTMELLEKPRSILEVARREQALTARIELLIQTLQALAYLHRRSIVHRDLKPGNILVVNETIKLPNGTATSQRSAKVLDFGLATTELDADSIAGTPAYIAPEVLLGEAATVASDLYAVGVIAYEMLAERHPFDTSSLDKLISQTIETNPNLTPIITRWEKPTKTPETDETGEADEPAEQTEQADNGETLDHLSDIIEREQREDIDTLAGITNAPVTIQLDQAHTRALPPVEALPDLPLYPTLPGERPSHQLSIIVQRLLNKNPRARYQDAQDVIRDLSRAIGRSPQVETAATRDSYLQAAEFVGRREELRQLLAALEQAQERKGSFWLITGESGVGKSRLLDELRIRALVRSIGVARGQTNAAARPYQLWRDPLRQLILDVPLDDSDAATLQPIIPDLSTLIGRVIPPRMAQIDPEQAQKQLISTMVKLFEQRQAPILILLEDLHWAGSESIDLLNQLRRTLEHGDLPIMIVASLRDDEGTPLPASLQNAHTLPLKRLDEPDIVRLTTFMLGPKARQREELIDLVRRESEGNVFFLIEVIRVLAGLAGELQRIGEVALPPQIFAGGIERIIQRNLHRVPAEYLPLLEAAALIGRHLELPLLEAIAPKMNLPEWLLVISEAGVLEIQNEKWQFRHEKFRDGLIHDLPPETRRAHHVKIATALEQLSSSNRDRAAMLADHWTQAGDLRRALPRLIEAGEQAYQISAYTEARRFFEQALSILEEADWIEVVENLEKHRSLLLLWLAKVNMRQNVYGEATDLLQEVLLLTGITHEQEKEAEANLLLGQTSMYLGEPENAIMFFEQAQTRYRTLNNLAGLADAMRGLARLAAVRGDMPKAGEYLTSSLALSREANNRWMISKVLTDLGRVEATQGHFGAARGYLQESLEIYTRLGNLEGMANVLLDLGQSYIFENNLPEARQYFIRSLALYRKVGSPRAPADVLNNLGYIALLQDALPKAREYFEECIEIYRNIGFEWGLANSLANLGHTFARLNDAPSARQHYRDALHHAKALGAVPLVLEVLVGFTSLMKDEPTRAVRWLALATQHPACSPDTATLAEPILKELREKLAPEAFESAFQQGAKEDLDEAINQLLVDKAAA
jgi:serine/threonine protein kinase/tetratricopeptide (TPR) repeat protein